MWVQLVRCVDWVKRGLDEPLGSCNRQLPDLACVQWLGWLGSTGHCDALLVGLLCPSGRSVLNETANIETEPQFWCSNLGRCHSCLSMADRQQTASRLAAWVARLCSMSILTDCQRCGLVLR